MVALALRLDFGPTPEVTRFRDDAYYEFAWARSVAAGEGPCVTPGVRTSGVQHLWSALLALGAALLGAPATPIVAQVLGLCCHALAAVAIARLLWPHRFAALAAALLYLGSPFAISEAQNGQETALAALATALLLGAVRASERAFAAAAVFATLARSDLFLFVPFLAIHRHGVRLRAGATPLLALAAHVAVNFALAGHALQDSALPTPWLFEQHFRAGDPDLLDRLQRLWWWLRPCLLGAPWGLASPLLAGCLVWAALAPRAGRLTGVAALVAVTLASWLGADDLEVPTAAALLLVLAGGVATPARGRPPFAALCAGSFALLFLHYVLRHHPRQYYFAPLAVAGAYALGWLVSLRPRLGAAVALAVAVLQVQAARAPGERFAWQAEMAMAAHCAPRLLPGGSAIGCFNAGIATWRYPGPVLNLDGVVNRPAFAALRRRELAAYLDAHGVRFLLDAPEQFLVRSDAPHVSHASGLSFGGGFAPQRDLRALVRFAVPGVDAGRPGTDAVCLYWRVGRGPPPPLPRTAEDLGPAPGGGRWVLWPARAGSTLAVVREGGALPSLPLARANADVVHVVKVALAAPGRYELRDSAEPEPILRFAVDP